MSERLRLKRLAMSEAALLAGIDSSAAKGGSSTQADDAGMASELVESMYAATALLQQGKERATTPAVKRLVKELETAYKNGVMLP